MISSNIKKGEVIQSPITSLTFIPKTDFYVQNVLFMIEPKLLVKIQLDNHSRIFMLHHLKTC